MHKVATKLTSTIAVHISSSTGTQDLDVLPDSVVDICMVGQKPLEHLGQHSNNILPSGF